MRSQASDYNDYIDALAALQQGNQQPKLGLDNIRSMLAILGQPQRGMVFFHLAGTNGKGSTGAFLDSMLRAGDVHTGWFSSPHLSCARERMRIGGQPVSEKDFCWAQKTLFSAAEKAGLHPSYFESTFAMALLLFRKHGVRTAVLEVGLGGLYDATNVVQPRVCGITSISLDHVHILGHSLAAIATQKTGIIKAGIPIFSAQQPLTVAKVIAAEAYKKGAPLASVGQEISFAISDDHRFSVYHGTRQLVADAYLGIGGHHQYGNAALALAMLEESKLVPTPLARVRGLRQVKWPGRYEIFRGPPPVLLDGAHNPAGFSSLFAAISRDANFAQKPIIAIVGLTNGHQNRDMEVAWLNSGLAIKEVIFTRSRNQRAINPHQAAQLFPRLHSRLSVVPSPQRALREAMHRASAQNALVLVTGSLYLVGELRVHFVDEPSDPFLPVF